MIKALIGAKKNIPKKVIVQLWIIFSLTIFPKELAKTTGVNWPFYFIKKNNKCHHIELYIDIST